MAHLEAVRKGGMEIWLY